MMKSIIYRTEEKSCGCAATVMTGTLVSCGAYGITLRTPYAAGQTVITGTAGLSVSGNVENLLRKTAKKAVETANLVREREEYQ
jgi:hypothetical protein